MIILALETATRAGGWALVEDGTVVASGQGEASVSHDVRLPQPLIAMLADRGLTLDDVDALAVATGPGSFTGLRVGIATMQGLALATGKSIIPIPTLDAIAHDTAGAPEAATLEYIAVWLDGQRREIFAALYAIRRQQDVDGVSGPPTAGLLMPPQVGAPALIAAEIADLIGDAHAGFAGDGAERYRDAIDALGLRESRLFPVEPLAPSVARLAWLRRETAVSPHAVIPVYVRRPDAELARERAALITPSTEP
jgi:tRNA threonylcarbamoyladenosine biosynthesis protein TsaB